jgi:hypothetical protein
MRLFIICCTSMLYLTACQNANVEVSGLSAKSSDSKNSRTISSDSYGATVGITNPDNYKMNVRISSVQLEPTTQTSGGYRISAKITQ